MNLYDFYVNGVGFRMAQLAYGPDADRWVWSNDTESRPFDTAAECQQDAIAWVRRKEEEEQDHLEYEAEARVYGTYEQQHRMRGHE